MMVVCIILVLGFFLTMGFTIYLIHKENMYKLENNIKEDDNENY
jgi:hypothetical protein